MGNGMGSMWINSFEGSNYIRKSVDSLQSSLWLYTLFMVNIGFVYGYSMKNLWIISGYGQYMGNVWVIHG